MNPKPLLIIINMIQQKLSNSEQNQILSRPFRTAFVHWPRGDISVVCLQIQLGSHDGEENVQNTSPPQQ